MTRVTKVTIEGGNSIALVNRTKTNQVATDLMARADAWAGVEMGDDLFYAYVGILRGRVNKHKFEKIVHVEVVLYENEESILTADLPTVLDFLANDIYWNEAGNWSNATHAEVRVM